MDTWVHSQPYGPLPPFAVIGGHDCDGSPIYVGRAYHEGENLPAKVVPSKGTAFIAWGGTEHLKSHYEILCGQGYAWVPCYGGNVPANAVRTGITTTGEPLYVGRGHHSNSLCVGKIHPSHGCLYIPFGGQEVRLNTYEVLVQQPSDSWVASTPNYTPPGSVVAGYDTDRATIYVGVKWVHCSAYSPMPTDAVIGGNDADGAPIYVGRAFHNGDMLVAKVLPSKNAAYVSWRGAEIEKNHFEVLCSQNVSWRKCHSHMIPENAVVCGNTALGQPVYIGRGEFQGSLTVGKVSSVHRALFIPFGGIERRLTTYEILVEEGQTPPGWSVNSPVPSAPLEIKPIIKYEYDPPTMPKPCPLDPFPAPIYPPVRPIDPPPPYAPPQSAYPPPQTYYPPQLSYPPPQTSYPPEESYDTWAVASSSYTPPNAVHAGHDADFATIFVCRAYHDGDLIPGKAIPSRGCAYISYNGEEIPKTNFEILVGDRYRWVPACDGNVAPGAIEAGRTESGEPLFVGRANYCGSLTPGKIQRSHQCLYIPFAGRERRVTNYEVLVRGGEFY